MEVKAAGGFQKSDVDASQRANVKRLRDIVSLLQFTSLECGLGKSHFTEEVEVGASCEGEVGALMGYGSIPGEEKKLTLGHWRAPGELWAHSQNERGLC